MASGYTSSKETTNFAKFSWIIVEICRDVLFDIVSLEIAPIDIPKKIKATPHKVKLYQEQMRSICNKPGGAAPNNEDFDIPSLYTVLRNLCSGIQPPTRGWFDNTLQNHPLPADVRVSDDVERLRNKRNALFGHVKKAEMTDSFFHQEMSEIKQIFTRLDRYLGSHYMNDVTHVEACCMDPKMEESYILQADEQEKQDAETRKLLKVEQKKITEMGVMVDKLTESHSQEKAFHEQTRKEIGVTNKALIDVRDDQTKTKRDILELQENQQEADTLRIKQTHEFHEFMIETKDSVKDMRAQHEEMKKHSDEQIQLVKDEQESFAGQISDQESKAATDRQLLYTLQLQQIGMKNDIDAMKEGAPTQQDPREAAETSLHETRLREQLQQTYLEDGTLKVSVVPSAHDVHLSQVYTTIVIREDLENANLQRGEPTVSLRLTGEADPTQTQDTNPVIDSYHDMLYKENVLQKNIYLLGQAGSGKTTFCKHVVDLWCRSPCTSHLENIEEITNFEYVFFVSCRDAECSDTILDMILNQLFDTDTDYLQATVQHVMNTKAEKCLILVDGLDEWAGSPSKSTGARSPCGLPSRKGLEKCVVLTTSRPWRIEALRQGLGKLHRILEIQGLTKYNMKKLSENVLSAFGVSPVSDALNKFMSDIKAAKMTEIVKTPLMHVIVLTAWLTNRKLDRSLCVNFMNMIECLIQRSVGMSGRTGDTNRLADISKLRKLKFEWAKQNKPLPHCFDNVEFCAQFAPLILKLANFAFDALFHERKEKALVFSIDELEKFFKKSELEVCLKIGLLSLAAAPIKSVKRITKVSFLHKSLQEYFAALWMAIEESQHWLVVFKSHCQSLTDVLDYSRVVVFVCGLSQDKGRELWKTISELTGTHRLVKEHRQAIASPFKSVRHDDPATQVVTRLYQLSLDCSTETNHSLPSHSESHVNHYRMPDIDVYGEMFAERQCLVYDQILASPSEVRSLIIDRTELAPLLVENLHKLVNLERLHIEPKSRSSSQQCSTVYSSISDLTSLRSLYIENCWSVSDTDNHLSLMLPQLMKLTLVGNSSITSMLHLSLPIFMATIYVENITLSHSSIVSLASLLASSSSLQLLDLRWLRCGDCSDGCRFDVDLTRHSLLERLVLNDRFTCVQSVCVSPDMTRLKWIGLYSLQMPPKAWRNFLLSLPKLANELRVELYVNEMDTESGRYIEDHFTVSCSVTDSNGFRTIVFHSGVPT